MIRQKLGSGMGKDVFWTFSLQIMILFCSFAVNKLLSNRLSIDDFGQYNVIRRSVQVLSFVMLAGVGITLPRYIPLYRHKALKGQIPALLSAALIYIIGVSSLVFLFCLFFSRQVQSIIIGEHGEAVLYFVALAYAFVLAMAQFVYAYYRGTGNFKWYNGAQLGVQTAIILPLLLLPVISITDVFVSWLAITALLVTFYCGRELWVRYNRMPKPVFAAFRPSRSALSTIIRYSPGRLLADFFLFSLSAFPLVYVSNRMGLQPAAYYSIGITLVTMVTPFFAFMGVILLPYVSERIASNELRAADRLIGRLTLLYIAASLLLTLVFYVFIGFLINLFFSNSYTESASLARIMILSILPQALYLLYRNPIDAVSVVPYNTIILGTCLGVMTVSFFLSSTLTQLAWAYSGVSVLQGTLSWLAWRVLLKKNL